MQPSTTERVVMDLTQEEIESNSFSFGNKNAGDSKEKPISVENENTYFDVKEQKVSIRVLRSRDQKVNKKTDITKDE